MLKIYSVSVSMILLCSVFFSCEREDLNVGEMPNTATALKKTPEKETVGH